MQQKILFCLFLTIGLELQAQLTITPGSQHYMTGTAEVTLHNNSPINNGNFVVGQRTVSFTGNLQTVILGTQPVNFCRMTVNKTGGNLVSLQRAVGVSDPLLLTDGLLNLNDFDLYLGTFGGLSGESETARTTPPGTGKVLLSNWINASCGINPCNLGAVLTAAQSLGNVSISRGHQVQVKANGTPPTARRNYDIVSSTGSSFFGTLRLHYLDAELNGANENAMTLYTSPNGSNWLKQNTTNKSPQLNYLEISRTILGKQWAMANIAPSINTVARQYSAEAMQKDVDPAQTQTDRHLNKFNNLPAAALAFRLWPNPTTGTSFLTIYSATKTPVTPLASRAAKAHW